MKKYSEKTSKLAAALLAVCMLTACGDSSSGSSGSSTSSEAAVSPAQRCENLLSAVDFPEMVEVTSDRLTVYYGFEEGDVTEFSAYICGSGAMPDEFGVFVTSGTDAAARVKSALETRIEKQRSTYADDTPEEMYKLEDSFVSVNGTTVCYAVCADNSAAEDILK